MACEKCWGDAYNRMRFVDPTRSQSDHYRDLLEERKGNPCTPEEQRGEHPCAYCGKMSRYKYCSNACEDDAYDEHIEKGR